MGNRKIAIERVKDCKRYVTFSKRKKGLFSKASMACDKYGSKIAIILFSPTGKPYVFGPVHSLIDRFLHHQSSSSSFSATNSGGGGGGTATDHIEGGKKKRSRSCCRDDNGDDLFAEREMKKRKLSMITEATAAEEQEKEGFLSPPVASSSSLVSDDELNETLLGFADYIAGNADNDEDCAFPFSDNWATIDVQDQLLS